MYLNGGMSKWLPEEQQHLKKLRESDKFKSWTILAKQLSKMFPKRNRNGKQCRQRYVNYSRYGVAEKISHSQWTHEEQIRFIDKIQQYGTNWKSIHEQLSIKSENCLKNKFYNSLRKFARKINIFHPKNYSPVNFQSIKRLILFKQFIKDQVLHDLVHKILYYSQVGQSILLEDQALEMLDKIHKFNVSTKYLNFKKKLQRKNHKQALNKDESKDQNVSYDENIVQKLEESEKNSPFLIEQYQVKIQANNQIQIESQSMNKHQQFQVSQLNFWKYLQEMNFLKAKIQDQINDLMNRHMSIKIAMFLLNKFPQLCQKKQQSKKTYFDFPSHHLKGQDQ